MCGTLRVKNSFQCFACFQILVLQGIKPIGEVSPELVGVICLLFLVFELLVDAALVRAGCLGWG